MMYILKPCVLVKQHGGGGGVLVKQHGQAVNETWLAYCKTMYWYLVLVSSIGI